MTANLPAYTPAGTITNGAITHNAVGGSAGAASDITPGSVLGSYSGASITQGASTFTGAPQGGTSVPIRAGVTQPTIVMN